MKDLSTDQPTNWLTRVHRKGTITIIHGKVYLLLYWKFIFTSNRSHWCHWFQLILIRFCVYHALFAQGLWRQTAGQVDETVFWKVLFFRASEHYQTWKIEYIYHWDQNIYNQRFGSISFWRGSGSGSWDPQLGKVDPDPDPRIHIWEKWIRILGSTFP